MHDGLPIPADAPARPVRRWRRALGGAAFAALLAAVFALYLRPGLALDLGQLAAICGFR